jgi:hypothetical protein
MAPGIFDGSLVGMAHPMLDLGEGLLDRVEIGRMGADESRFKTAGIDDKAGLKRLCRECGAMDKTLPRIAPQSPRSCLQTAVTELV